MNELPAHHDRTGLPPSGYAKGSDSSRRRCPTRITQFDLNTVEVQRGDETERFVRTSAEQVKGDFDELIELVGGYPYLAASGIAVARRIVR